MDRKEKIRLILVYGRVDSSPCGKQQAMIDERWTCGYREYAKQPGVVIIYPRPQSNMKHAWEMSMPRGVGLVDYCKSHPDAVIWSVKKDKRKNVLLAQTPNFKVYYSSCANHGVQKIADISLVDTEARMRGRSAIHLKGKDPSFWKPIDQPKEYDYLLMGKRGDKNEIFFLKQLGKVKTPRSILWLGGIKHKKTARKILAKHHSIKVTSMYGMTKVRDHISKAKVGILYSELAVEGFPQTFLEMTMCGVPVVYGGPQNKYYFFPENSERPRKKHLVIAAEDLLTRYNSKACRKRAVENYSIEKSIDRILSFKGKK